MPKRLPTAQTATKAAALLKDLLNDLNWVCSTLIEDFGIDLHMETPSEDTVYSEHFWPTADRPYRQPLPSPDPTIRDLALARCVLCQNYFWIDESATDGCDRLLPGEHIPENVDFTPIYGPRAHE